MKIVKALHWKHMHIMSPTNSLAEPQLKSLRSSTVKIKFTQTSISRIQWSRKEKNNCQKCNSATRRPKISFLNFSFHRNYNIPMILGENLSKCL